MQKNEQPLPKKAEEIQAGTPETSLKDYLLSLPPGAKLSDIFIDMEDLTTQLKFSKRTINNMRKAGQLSHTFLVEKGKVFYFVKELSAILKANAVIGKNSPLKKQGFVKSVTSFIGLFSLLPFDVETLAAFVCVA